MSLWACKIDSVFLHVCIYIRETSLIWVIDTPIKKKSVTNWLIMQACLQYNNDR